MNLPGGYEKGGENVGHYKVIFLGLAVAGPEEEVRLLKGLQKRFNLTPERAESLVQRVPIVVKKGSSKEELEKYVRVFEQIGGKVRLEEEEEPLPEPFEAPRESPREVAPRAAREAPPEVSPEVPPEAPPKVPYEAPHEAAASPEAQKKRYEGRTITCPQCGFEQPETDDCLKCGIIISKYKREQELARGLDGKIREVSGEERGTAWEGGGGFISAFFKTVKESLFSPVQFFRNNAVGKGYWPALIYGLIVGVIGLGVSMVWQWHFFSRWFPVRSFPAIPYNLHLVVMTMALPFLVVLSVLIGSVVTHICLLIVGGNKSGFRTTFRVICYSYSGQLFFIIPFIGSTVGSIYTLILTIIGVREGHGISTGRAVLAVLFPLILAVGLGILAAIFLPLFLGGIKFFGGVGV
jgi:hypothetical protein